MLVDDECTLIMPGREAEMKQPAHGISLLAQDAVVVHGASDAASGAMQGAATVLDAM